MSWKPSHDRIIVRFRATNRCADEHLNLHCITKDGFLYIAALRDDVSSAVAFYPLDVIHGVFFFDA